MPELTVHLIELLVGSSPLLGILAWWLKARHDDRVAKDLAQAEREAALQKEIKDILNDRIRDEVVRRQSVDQTMQLLQTLVEFAKSGKGTQ